MKSRTSRTSRNTQPKKKTPKKRSPSVGGTGISEPLESLQDLGSSLTAAMAVGYQPSNRLTPQDEALFRAFQSNLLSLISHELRTPLMGILNSLTLLDEEVGHLGKTLPATHGGSIPMGELLKMARQNAVRLNQTLSTLLDMAAIESETFHARLREVELTRLVRGRFEAGQYNWRDRGLRAQWESLVDSPVLADPQKLGRAIDLCLQLLLSFAPQGSEVLIRNALARVDFEFEVDAGRLEAWNAAWSEGKMAFESGLGSPASAFGGVLQSEQAFLSRSEEGLGSEMLLIHHLMKLHQGRLDQRITDQKVRLSLILPPLDSEQALRAVLTSRAFYVSTELGAVALILMEVPEGLNVEDFQAKVRKSLFRSSDAVYALPSRKQIALVLDDCKLEDAPLVISRLEKSVHHSLRCGIAQCPADGLDPKALLDLAQERLDRNR